MGHRAEKRAWGGKRKAHKGEGKPVSQPPKIGRVDPDDKTKRKWAPRHVS
jgi:hypothetical protein